MKNKAGELIIITSGEYDDFEILHVCLAVFDFDSNDVILEYLEDHKDQALDGSFDSAMFLRWLMLKNYLMPAAKSIWHLGPGGTPDLPKRCKFQRSRDDVKVIKSSLEIGSDARTAEP